jgi:group I intron endonuclease
MTVTGIYGLKNVTCAKWYVGQSVDVSTRKRSHFAALTRGDHHNSHLQSAFQLGGRAAFEFHILEVVPENMLDVRERAWIAYYQSHHQEHGYNFEDGGNLMKRPSDATRKKMSASQIGKRHSLQSRLKMSIASRGVAKTASHIKHLSLSLKGRKISEEHRQKIITARTGKPLSDETRRKISESRKGRKFPRLEKS